MNTNANLPYSEHQAIFEELTDLSGDIIDSQYFASAHAQPPRLQVDAEQTLNIYVPGELHLGPMLAAHISLRESLDSTAEANRTTHLVVGDVSNHSSIILNLDDLSGQFDVQFSGDFQSDNPIDFAFIEAAVEALPNEIEDLLLAPSKKLLQEALVLREEQGYIHSADLDADLAAFTALSLRLGLQELTLREADVYKTQLDPLAGPGLFVRSAITDAEDEPVYPTELSDDCPFPLSLVLSCTVDQSRQEDGILVVDTSQGSDQRHYEQDQLVLATLILELSDPESRHLAGDGNMTLGAEQLNPINARNLLPAFHHALETHERQLGRIYN